MFIWWIVNKITSGRIKQYIRIYQDFDGKDLKRTVLRWRERVRIDREAERGSLVV